MESLRASASKPLFPGVGRFQSGNRQTGYGAKQVVRQERVALQGLVQFLLPCFRADGAGHFPGLCHFARKRLHIGNIARAFLEAGLVKRLAAELPASLPDGAEGYTSPPRLSSVWDNSRPNQAGRNSPITSRLNTQLANTLNATLCDFSAIRAPTGLAEPTEMRMMSLRPASSRKASIRAACWSTPDTGWEAPKPGRRMLNTPNPALAASMQNPRAAQRDTLWRSGIRAGEDDPRQTACTPARCSSSRRARSARSAARASCPQPDPGGLPVQALTDCEANSLRFTYRKDVWWGMLESASGAIISQETILSRHRMRMIATIPETIIIPNTLSAIVTAAFTTESEVTPNHHTTHHLPAPDG